MLSNKEWEKINEIIAKINRIDSDSCFRSRFLESLMELIDFSFSDFAVGLVKKNSFPFLRETIIVSKFDKEFEKAFMGLYESTYASLDYISWVFLSPDSLVYRESDLLNNEVRKRNPFYSDYLAEYNLVNVCGLVIAHDGRFLGNISIYRGEEKGDFSDKDLYILKQFLPHLQLKLENLSMNSSEKKNNSKSPSYVLKHHFNLTNQEIRIVECIYKGYSNLEVGDILSISKGTVKKHVYNVFNKLQVTSRTQLVKLLIDNELTHVFPNDDLKER